MDCDQIDDINGSRIQHGELNDRIYLMHLGSARISQTVKGIDKLAKEKGYSKIFAKIPAWAGKHFTKSGYTIEAKVRKFFSGEVDGLFMGKYLSPARKKLSNEKELREIIDLAKSKATVQGGIRRRRKSDVEDEAPDCDVMQAAADDVPEMAKLYKKVFASYPFPIHDEAYLLHTMEEHVRYFYIKENGRMVALASSEMDVLQKNVEMTDFATDPDLRGKGYGNKLLSTMERAMRTEEMCTAYTIARAESPGMNIVFAKNGYAYGGMLKNNTNICGKLESMNVWYKQL